MDIQAAKKRCEAATEGVLLELYGVWSEEAYAAGFMLPSVETVAAFREWLKQRPLVATEDYEKEMLAEFKRQGDWPEWWGFFTDLPAALEALEEAQGKIERLRDHHALYCVCGTLTAAILGESE